MAQVSDSFKPGDRVRVVQQIPQRDGDCWVAAGEGTVVSLKQAKTGSWYAHAKDERLWLDRLTLRADDGEVNVYILDAYTHIEVVERQSVEPSKAPESANAEVEGGPPMEVEGHVESGRYAGEGVADTPSGDLGEPTERK